MSSNQDLEYNGKKYTSLKKVYNDNGGNHPVCYHQFARRIREGLSIEKALNNEKRIGSHGKHTVNGVEYKSLSEVGRVFGIPANTLKNRFLRSGYRGDDLVKEHNGHNHDTTFYVDGVEYESKEAAAKNFGISYTTLKKRLNDGFTPEEAFGLVENKKPKTTKGRTAKTYKIGGAEKTITELSAEYNVPRGTVRNRLSQGATTRQAIGLDVIPKGSLPHIEACRKTKRKIQAYTVNCKTYDSLTAVARDYDLGRSTIVDRMEKHSLTVEQAVNRDYPHSITYNGKVYENLRSLANEKGIKFATLKKRLYRQKLSLEDAVEAGSDRIPREGVYTQRLFDKNRELANTSGELYFIDVFVRGRWSHKIGITKRTMESRITGEGVEYKKIKVVKGRLEDCYQQELKIKDMFLDKQRKGLNLTDLAGYTEVFDLDDKNIRKVKRMMKSTPLLPKVGKKEAELQSLYDFCQDIKPYPNHLCRALLTEMALIRAAE